VVYKIKYEFQQKLDYFSDLTESVIFVFWKVQRKWKSIFLTKSRKDILLKQFEMREREIAFIKVKRIIFGNPVIKYAIQ